LAAEEQLTQEELWMMGDQMELDTLPAHAQCSDMYYRRLYTPWKEGSDLFGQPLSEIHNFNFEFLVSSWTAHLDGVYRDGSLAAASQKETKKELRKMEGEWKQDQGISQEDKDEKFFFLLAWSKFRYVLARRIFDLDIKGEYYPMTLNGKEFRFDYESALHILTRHYGHGMKPYKSEKDHFYGVFAYNELNSEFENIFSAIDASGLYQHDSLEEITFRYKDVVYRIYTHPRNFEESIYRISTFFPVSNAAILAKLEKEFHEENLNEDLTVFIKNVN
jgi:hypothetical protein